MVFVMVGDIILLLDFDNDGICIYVIKFVEGFIVILLFCMVDLEIF